jgi:hypothetical protein
VVQEVEGLLLAQCAVRALRQDEAAREGLDPDRLSFTAALQVLRCRLAEVPKTPRDQAGRKRWWEALLAEAGEAALPARRRRVNPRVSKRKRGSRKKKRPRRRHPRPTRPSSLDFHGTTAG